MTAALGGPVRVAPYALYGSDELAAAMLDALRDRTGCLLQQPRHRRPTATPWTRPTTAPPSWSGCAGSGSPPQLRARADTPRLLVGRRQLDAAAAPAARLRPAGPRHGLTAAPAPSPARLPPSWPHPAALRRHWRDAPGVPRRPLAATTVLGAGAAAVAAGRYASDTALQTRRATSPCPGDVPAHRALRRPTSRVALTRSLASLRPGTYGLTGTRLPRRRRLRGPRLPHPADTVVRRLERRHPRHPAARAPGAAHPAGARGNPRDALGLDHADVDVPGELGPLPAWFVPGVRDTWVITVHGLGTTREHPHGRPAAPAPPPASRSSTSPTATTPAPRAPPTASATSATPNGATWTRRCRYAVALRRRAASCSTAGPPARPWRCAPPPRSAAARAGSAASSWTRRCWTGGPPSARWPPPGGVPRALLPLVVRAAEGRTGVPAGPARRRRRPGRSSTCPPCSCTAPTTPIAPWTASRALRRPPRRTWSRLHAGPARPARRDVERRPRGLRGGAAALPDPADVSPAPGPRAARAYGGQLPHRDGAAQWPVPEGRVRGSVWDFGPSAEDCSCDVPYPARHPAPPRPPRPLAAARRAVTARTRSARRPRPPEGTPPPRGARPAGPGRAGRRGPPRPLGRQRGTRRRLRADPTGTLPEAAVERGRRGAAPDARQVRADWDRARLAGLVELHGGTARPGWRLRAWDRDDTAVLRGWVALFDAWSLAHPAPGRAPAPRWSPKSSRPHPSCCPCCTCPPGRCRSPRCWTCCASASPNCAPSAARSPTAGAAPAAPPPPRRARLTLRGLAAVSAGLAWSAAIVGARAVGDAGRATATRRPTRSPRSATGRCGSSWSRSASPRRARPGTSSSPPRTCCAAAPGSPPARPAPSTAPGSPPAPSARPSPSCWTSARGDDALLRGLAFEALRVVGAPGRGRRARRRRRAGAAPVRPAVAGRAGGRRPRGRARRAHPRGGHLAVGGHRRGRRRPRRGASCWSATWRRRCRARCPALLEEVRAVGHPRTVQVLVALAAAHPDPALAKAVRRAAFQVHTGEA